MFFTCNDTDYVDTYLAMRDQFYKPDDDVPKLITHVGQRYVYCI